MCFRLILICLRKQVLVRVTEENRDRLKWCIEIVRFHMKKLIFFLILIFLVIYIISPFDFFPHFIDDLFAFGLLWYMWRKRPRQGRQWGRYYSNTQSQGSKRSGSGTGGDLDLGEACRLFGVNPNTSLDEIQKAYKEKVAKSHPDKVAHLSEELQMKAKELTLQFNKAIDVIRRHKKV